MPRKTGGKDFQLGAGRRAAPWTDVPDWVAFAPGHTVVTETADGKKVKKQVMIARPCNTCHSLYSKMKIHINVKSGDPTVYPSKASLAHLVGMEREDYLDPHLTHLREIGAIDWVERGSKNGTNLYLVNELPPEGYTGPVNIDEYYKLNRPAHAAIRDASAGKARASRERKKQGVDPQPPEAETNVTGSDRERAVTGSDRYRVTGSDRERVTGSDRLKQHRGLTTKNFNNNTLDGASSEPTEPVVQDPVVMEDPQLTTTAASVLDDLLQLAEVPAVRHPVGKNRTQLIGLLEGPLRAGWPRAALVKALDGFGPLNGTATRSVFGAVRWRINELAETAPPRANVVAPRQAEPCPYSCDPAGLIEISRDRQIWCPHCRVEASARQVAKFAESHPELSTFEQLREHMQGLVSV